MLAARCNVLVRLLGCVISFPALAKRVVYSPKVSPGEIETAYYLDAAQGAAGGMGFYVEYCQARNAVDQVEVKSLYETEIPEQAIRVRLNAEIGRGFGGGADSGTVLGYAAWRERAEVSGIARFFLTRIFLVREGFEVGTYEQTAG